ncbi:MAG: retention module-containing protein, partial [Desulfurivibrionaceae bacterium]
MAKQAIATVANVIGRAFARNENGELRTIKQGDVLLEGETIITSADGRVELSFMDGSDMTVTADQTVLMAAELLASGQQPDAAAAALAGATSEQVLQALAEGKDISEILEAPAAGLGGGAEGEGNSFVRLLRIVEPVDPLAFQFESSVSDVPPTFEAGAAPEGAIVASLISVAPTGDAEGILEGGSMIFTVGLSQASTSDITVTLSNGVTVTIPAGQLTGASEPVPVQGDDPYIDPSVESTNITGITGGGTDEVLSIDPTPVGYTVSDTIDTTTISLSVEGANEDAASVTFSATLSNPGETEVTITTNLGDIVIAAGQTTGTL